MTAVRFLRVAVIFCFGFGVTGPALCTYFHPSVNIMNTAQFLRLAEYWVERAGIILFCTKFSLLLFERKSCII